MLQKESFCIEGNFSILAHHFFFLGQLDFKIVDCEYVDFFLWFLSFFY